MKIIESAIDYDIQFRQDIVKVGENGEYKMISTPDDLPFFGHEKDINYYAYLGTYNNSDKLSFLYTPPGAPNLPLQIILIP